MKLPVKELWSGSFRYDKTWRKAHKREQFPKNFNSFIYILSVHTEQTEVSPDCILGCTSSCNSNK